MEHHPEDRPHDATGQDPVDPLDVPAHTARRSDDQDPPPSEGDVTGQGGEGSGDGLWISSHGYLLAKAYKAARPQRPDLMDEEFRILANQAFPTLSGHEGSAVDEILAHVNAVRPPAGPEPPGASQPRVASRRRLRLEQALARLARTGRAAPTQAEIAEACRPQITERTLRSWLQKEPDLRDLLPWLPRTADNPGTKKLPENDRLLT